ncbi:MAG: CRISPR-associated endonuclease Cas3'' [Thermodesulfobacteriota bacterium]|nr:MAG: CRISPR-associated endonuclease Cas3'' [Thermodesulfobacteriota bacterium]
MSHSFKLKSHPDKLLKEHLENVGRLSKEILESKTIDCKKIFAEIAYIIGITHDFGKATTYFQNWLENGRKTQYAQHGFLSSLVGYLTVKNFLSNIQKLDEFWYLPGIAWIVISKHHGNLRDILNEEAAKLKDSNELKIVEEQLNDIFFNNLTEILGIYRSLGLDISEILNDIKNLGHLAREVYRNVKRICMDSFNNKNLKYYFLVLFFYSVLLDADKLDASGRRNLPKREYIPSNIVDEYKKKKFGEPKTKVDIIREKAYNEVIAKVNDVDLIHERILSINLPTGCGKTLIGLSFSLKLRERIKASFGFTPKIIYSLPFLSIIDQNAEIIEEILKFKYKEYEEIPSNLLLTHHHLADIEYKEIKNGELSIEELNRSLLLTEGWHSEIVITTFVQLFHSLITNKNRAARKFHNITNSILILDEIQSIPHKYWLLINKVLIYLAYNLNCWIILMTATKPLIFKDEEIKELVTNPKEYFNAFNRVIFNSDFKIRTLKEFKDEIWNKILSENKSILIVVNTINSCKELYEFLKDKFASLYGINKEDVIDEDGIANFPDLELINLSTHILPSYRLRRIDRIKNGSDSKSKKRKVIVTTQLIEAGVDISVDIVYRDFAPLDCLIQTAGRCNRNNERNKGNVNIVILKDERQEFYKYIYDSTLIDATRSVIEAFSGAVKEKDFVLSSVDKYYKIVLERGSKDESKNILESIIKLDFSKTVEFDLIQEKLPTISLFVEVDDVAEEIRKKMEEIFRSKKSLERKLELLKIRKKLNDYTISVKYLEKIKTTILELNKISNLDGFRYISKNELERYYKIDSGLNFEEYTTII